MLFGWMQVVHGQTTDTFRRHALPALASLSFSLVYVAGEGGPRTLDLIARTERDFELWFFGLQARGHYWIPYFQCTSSFCACIRDCFHDMLVQTQALVPP